MQMKVHWKQVWQVDEYIAAPGFSALLDKSQNTSQKNYCIYLSYNDMDFSQIFGALFGLSTPQCTMWAFGIVQYSFLTVSFPSPYTSLLLSITYLFFICLYFTLKHVTIHRNNMHICMTRVLSTESISKCHTCMCHSWKSDLAVQVPDVGLIYMYLDLLLHVRNP